MNQLAAKNDVIRQLQKEVLVLQGYKRPSAGQVQDKGLGALAAAFPDKTFPTGVVHEFVSAGAEGAAATNGFIAAVAGKLVRQRTCLWIGSKRTIYPPALKIFGIEPERIIFVDLCRQKDVLWAIEEALKCESLGAVIGELAELGFTESRRLQLAVEQSHVTGFIHRCNPRGKNTVASFARWQITPLASAPEGGMPGVGHPRWHVHLQKVRNGKPVAWQLEWRAGNFSQVRRQVIMLPEIKTRKTG